MVIIAKKVPPVVNSIEEEEERDKEQPIEPDVVLEVVEEIVEEVIGGPAVVLADDGCHKIVTSRRAEDA